MESTLGIKTRLKIGPACLKPLMFKGKLLLAYQHRWWFRTFSFLPLFGEMIQLDSYFFQMGGSTNNQNTTWSRNRLISLETQEVVMMGYADQDQRVTGIHMRCSEKQWVPAISPGKMHQTLVTQTPNGSGIFTERTLRKVCGVLFLPPLLMFF